MSDVIDDHTGDVQVGASADVPVLSGSIDDLSQHSTRSSTRRKRPVSGPVDLASEFGDKSAGTKTTQIALSASKAPANSKPKTKPSKPKQRDKQKGKGRANKGRKGKAKTRK